MMTTNEVCALCDLPPTTLKEWISQGLIVPATMGGPGRGNGHKFSVTAAVGIAVAAALVRSERGCSPEHVGRVVGAFGKLSESDLLARFERGATHFLLVSRLGYVVMDGPYYPDQPIARPIAGDLVDVEAIYQKLKAATVAVA